MFTDAHRYIPSHLRTHIYPHARAYTRRWLQTNADGAADVSVCARIYASVHAWMYKHRCRRTSYRWACLPRARACTNANMRRRARSDGIYAHTHTCTCTDAYVRRCMHVVIHVSWSRACAAPAARSLTHTHSHIRTLSWMMYLHAHIYI